MWLGTVTTGKTGGYGRLLYNGRLRPATVVSLEIHGVKVPDGMQVCHHCDNPGCVNPDHLFLDWNASTHTTCSSEQIKRTSLTRRRRDALVTKS